MSYPEIRLHRDAFSFQCSDQLSATIGSQMAKETDMKGRQSSPSPEILSTNKFCVPDRPDLRGWAERSVAGEEMIL